MNFNKLHHFYLIIWHLYSLTEKEEKKWKNVCEWMREEQEGKGKQEEGGELFEFSKNLKWFNDLSFMIISGEKNEKVGERERERERED